MKKIKNNEDLMEKMKKIIALMFVILMFLVGCKPENTDDNIIGENDQKDGVNEEKTGFEGITKQQCMDSYGNWNECGSPCAGTGAEMCAQVCRVQCECSGIAGFGCPEGYKCRLTGKIADEMGVCVKG